MRIVRERKINPVKITKWDERLTHPFYVFIQQMKQYFYYDADNTKPNLLLNMLKCIVIGLIPFVVCFKLHEMRNLHMFRFDNVVFDFIVNLLIWSATAIGMMVSFIPALISIPAMLCSPFILIYLIAISARTYVNGKEERDEIVKTAVAHDRELKEQERQRRNRMIEQAQEMQKRQRERSLRAIQSDQKGTGKQ